MSEKDHYRFGLSKRGKNVNDNNTLADDLRERIAALEARCREMEAALLEASARLRVAAIAGGSDEEYADLAIERYVKLIDSTKEPPVSTLCAICDQIKELHPASHEWTAKETGAAE